MILKVNLHNLVGEPKHDRMLGSHPLFNIDMGIHLQLFAILIGRIVSTGEMVLVLHAT